MLNTALNRARSYAKAIELAERRQNERHSVFVQAMMRDINNDCVPIVVSNISPIGLLAEGYGKYRIGAPVTLDLPGFGDTDAIIRWAGQDMVGCEFVEPIDVALFRQMIRFLPRP
jgi:hypothetical protein